jgi:hypothetical protein
MLLRRDLEGGWHVHPVVTIPTGIPCPHVEPALNATGLTREQAQGLLLRNVAGARNVVIVSQRAKGFRFGAECSGAEGHGLLGSIMEEPRAVEEAWQHAVMEHTEEPGEGLGPAWPPCEFCGEFHFSERCPRPRS